MYETVFDVFLTDLGADGTVQNSNTIYQIALKRDRVLVVNEGFQRELDPVPDDW